ncbi:MAG: alanine--tRNA ligase, partial [bacterium]
MESKQIRETFINYFASKGHTIVPGWPVVPKGDPTLLFTNAGMNQFKDLLLGKEIRSYKRAANYQKCLRISGKHNDLEQVGKDDYHHTFFEMLGNWSFGDYFKKEAIEFAWELLTEVYKIDKKRLWATVYKDDDESENYWITRIGLPRERVLRFDEKYNFWEMGDVGPCGPCTEIHYDYGEEFGCGEPNCRPNCGCGRFVEVWNIVFMEYFRDENGTLHPLPQKNVDTGMGFERLTSIIQAKTSNYQTDLFQPIIKKLEQLSGKWFLDEKNKIPMRVIADHIRAISFAIADGVIPGNEGRGYVIRRILRRASRYGRELDFHTPFLYKLVEPLVGIMGDAYPELEKHRDEIEKIIASEEERFIQTLDRGIELFEDYVESLLKEGKKILPGKLVFKLYDTYGFPVDLT